MHEYELRMTSRHKLVFKRSQHGDVYVEIQAPGADSFGHGFMVVDSLFLDRSEVENIIAVLGAETTRTQTPQKPDLMLNSKISGTKIAVEYAETAEF